MTQRRGPTTTTKERYTTHPQPHEPLLMGWIVGGMTTRVPTHKQQGTDDDKNEHQGPMTTRNGPVPHNDDGMT
jgi:hypothetical protein